MNVSDPKNDPRRSTGKSEPSVRPGFRLVLIGLLAALIGGGLYLKRLATRSAGSAPASPQESASASSVSAPPAEAPIRESTVVAVAAKAPRPLDQRPAPPPSPPLPEPSPQTRQLVASLSRLDQLGRSMTPEQAAAWKQNLQQLVQQGRDAVPAIAEFLKQNKDVDFGTGVSQALGYGSLRRAMFDALGQIGGPEAIGAAWETLQNSADPREIALLAQTLDKLGPDQHRQEALQAAREALALAANGKLDGADVAPLFEVLQKYGGPEAVSELEQATGKWKYYATIALAQLPDGAGIPSLIQMAQDPNAGSGTRTPALEMLAQLSLQSPEARTVLLDQTRLNAISPYTWQTLVPILAGDQMGFLNSEYEDHTTFNGVSGLKTTHLSFGNQNFYSIPGVLTPDQISQRSALIDELLALNPNQAAKDALQQARDLLSRRVPKTVATAP